MDAEKNEDEVVETKIETTHKDKEVETETRKVPDSSESED